MGGFVILCRLQPCDLLIVQQLTEVQLTTSSSSKLVNNALDFHISGKQIFFSPLQFVQTFFGG
jgi:hypothetical protein